MSNNNDTFGKTMLVVLATCLVCALVVSSAAVSLRPEQINQRALDKQRNILSAAGIVAGKGQVPELYSKFIEAKVIDLATGEFVSDIDGNKFDQRLALKKPQYAKKLLAEHDVAGIRVISRLANVYVARDESGAVASYIIPVHGMGLWSTMYAFLSLAPDGNTVKSLVYYDQGETPGLGAEVTNPAWIAQWDGKQLFDAAGQPAIDVVKGKADPASSHFVHQIDGLAGATLTSNGVENTFKFWLGEQGFGPFLAKLRQGAANHG